MTRSVDLRHAVSFKVIHTRGHLCFEETSGNLFRGIVLVKGIAKQKKVIPLVKAIVVGASLSRFSGRGYNRKAVGQVSCESQILGERKDDEEVDT